MQSGFWDAASNWAIATSGYRKYGLRATDLIRDEADGVQEAIRRMPQEYQDERYFRLKRAMNLSMKYDYLPQSEWTTQEQDTKEIVPVIEKVRAEEAERAAWDNQNA